MIDQPLQELLQYGATHHLFEPSDYIYVRNQLMAVFSLDELALCEVGVPDSLSDILQQLSEEAIALGMIEDAQSQRDIFEAKLMNIMMPRPSEVIRIFQKNYQESPIKATDEFYQMSIASNYIQKERIAKNIIWQSETKYGKLDMTINLSKPEKDPKDIALALKQKPANYPKCLLCKENEGYAGRSNHPARSNHRIIPLTLHQEPWYLQYSPYTYYNEHCIVFYDQHVPMKIDRDTFHHLLDFVDLFPHYFLGSNADLPIVGGSILTHAHYQGGRHHFAMEDAPVLKIYALDSYPQVRAAHINWPLSTLRCTSKDKEALIAFADHVLTCWKQYDDPTCDIISHSEDVPHNTITPIAHKQGETYMLDLVLRNNRTNEEHPMGIFHPHAEVHHIKKENIGLIEVMGLAVLPARLQVEMEKVAQHLIAQQPTLMDDPSLQIHEAWYQEIYPEYDEKKDAMDFLKQKIAEVFAIVLEHAGVFKLDQDGIDGFDRFVATL